MLEPPFGRRYLQDRITSEFALARHLGIVVENADEHGVVLCAPLGANANGQGTAFGGSLFSVAVLGGWAWVTRYLDEAQLVGDTMIQESTIRYLVPVHGELRATLVPPTAAHVEKFRKMLQRAGRGRIRLEVRIHEGNRLASVFEGVFVAALR